MAKAYKNEWQEVIEAGDLEAATRLVSTTDINEVFELSGDPTSPEQTTPLKFAVKHEAFKIVELLIKSRADVNKPSGEAWALRPLDEAVLGDNVQLLRFLFENKADVNLNNKSGYWYPLERAAKKGKIAKVMVLLEFGVEAGSKVVSGLLSEASIKAQRLPLLGSDYYIKEVGSITNCLNMSKLFIRLYRKYSLDGDNTTALNEAKKILVNVKSCSDKEFQVKELAAEVLMLMANSPSMTYEIVQKTIECNTATYSSSEPKISDTYMQVLQEHPSWAIYNAALLQVLPPEAQALNQQNFERGVAATKAEIASRLDLVPYMPKAVREFILSFMSDADLIDAHCFARDIAHIPQAMEDPAPSAAPATDSAAAHHPGPDSSDIIGDTDFF